MDDNRHHIPIQIRALAALSHVGVIAPIPASLLVPTAHSILYKINGIDPRCLIKPLPSCDEMDRLLLLIINLSILSVIWALSFISPISIALVLKLSKDLNTFIRDNAEKAFQFQVKLAIVRVTIEVIILIVSSLLPSATLAGVAIVSLSIIMLELYLIPFIFIGIQLLFGMPTAVFALTGRTMSYPKIRL
jgi:uncharacterized Tic20 family protein